MCLAGVGAAKPCEVNHQLLLLAYYSECPASSSLPPPLCVCMCGWFDGNQRAVPAPALLAAPTVLFILDQKRGGRERGKNQNLYFVFRENLIKN